MSLWASLDCCHLLDIPTKQGKFKSLKPNRNYNNVVVTVHFSDGIKQVETVMQEQV